MKEFIVETFAHHRTLIVFLHVLSAVIWVGGMIAIRYATHQSLSMIADPKIRLERAAHTLKRLFTIVWPFVLVLVVTAIFIAVGLGFREAASSTSGNVEYAKSLYSIIHIKEAIWFVMALNLGAMMWRRAKAEAALNAGNIEEAANMLGLIARYMVPINIGLGIIAIYLGVFLRGAHA